MKSKNRTKTIPYLLAPAVKKTRIMRHLSLFGYPKIYLARGDVAFVNVRVAAHKHYATPEQLAAQHPDVKLCEYIRGYWFKKYSTYYIKNLVLHIGLRGGKLPQNVRSRRELVQQITARASCVHALDKVIIYEGEKGKGALRHAG